MLTDCTVTSKLHSWGTKYRTPWTVQSSKMSCSPCTLSCPSLKLLGAVIQERKAVLFQQLKEQKMIRSTHQLEVHLRAASSQRSLSYRHGEQVWEQFKVLGGRHSTRSFNSFLLIMFCTTDRETNVWWKHFTSCIWRWQHTLKYCTFVLWKDFWTYLKIIVIF